MNRIGRILGPIAWYAGLYVIICKTYLVQQYDYQQ